MTSNHPRGVGGDGPGGGGEQEDVERAKAQAEGEEEAHAAMVQSMKEEARAAKEELEGTICEMQAEHRERVLRLEEQAQAQAEEHGRVEAWAASLEAESAELRGALAAVHVTRPRSSSSSSLWSRN